MTRHAASTVTSNERQTLPTWLDDDHAQTGSSESKLFDEDGPSWLDTHDQDPEPGESASCPEHLADIWDELDHEQQQKAAAWASQEKKWKVVGPTEEQTKHLRLRRSLENQWRRQIEAARPTPLADPTLGKETDWGPEPRTDRVRPLVHVNQDPAPTQTYAIDPTQIRQRTIEPKTKSRLPMWIIAILLIAAAVGLVMFNLGKMPSRIDNAPQIDREAEVSRFELPTASASNLRTISNHPGH